MRLSATQPSLQSLNEYCLLHLFEFLQLEDSMNLAETCICLRKVADRFFKNYSKFVVDSETAEKGDVYFDRVILFIGQHVSSLWIDCWDELNLTQTAKIINGCNNLKSLRIDDYRDDWREDTHQNVQSIKDMLQNVESFRVDKVEQLTLCNCDTDFAMRVLEYVPKLKHLNIDVFNYDTDAVMRVLQKNPSLESFVHTEDGFPANINFQLLKLISNVERLCLDIDYENISELLKLDRLTKLSLYCDGLNISNFLVQLGTKKLQEIELHAVEVDYHFVDILMSFKMLQLLVIYQYSNRNCKSKLPTAWPAKLKHLRLIDFEFTLNAFISTIQQSKCLESIDLRQCTISESDTSYFVDVKKLTERMLQAMERRGGKQRLDVVLPCELKFDEYCSKVTNLNLSWSQSLINFVIFCSRNI